MLCKRVYIHLRDGGTVEVPAAYLYRPLAQGLVLVRTDEVGVDYLSEAQARTFGAGAPRSVEGEQPRLYLLYGYAAVGAGVVGRIQFLLIAAVDDDQPVAKFQRVFQAVGEALQYALLYNQPVHHDRYGMADVLFEADLILQIVDGAVYLHPAVTALFQRGEFLYKFPLFAARYGRLHHYLRLFGQRHHAVCDLVDGLLAYLPAALGAVRYADAREQQPEIVIDLRHRAHG